MLLRLDGTGPLHHQVYRSLREAILGGKLRPGTRLPSTRSVAADYGVSRNTVLFAYDQLLGEGYATARRGSGTYVPTELPDDLVAAGDGSNGTGVAPAARPRLSRFGRRAAALEWALPRGRLPYDFTYGKPSLRDFPQETWSRFVARRARRASLRDLDYGAPKGVRALRNEIADYLRRARAVVCEPEQVIVVGGSQQGLDLVARLLLDPGDRAVLEEPHYPGARNAFAAAGARLVPIEVGDAGLDVGALRRRVRSAKLVYVTPSHQFPTGVLMPVAQRLALLAWAESAGAYVVEDDYDSEYRYAGRPVASLQGLDRGRRVIYLGTFSKLMFPGLRIGYVVLPPPFLEPFVAARRVMGFSSPALEQLALADFIREGHFERHVRRSRVRNAARRAAVIEAIGECFGDRAEVSGADAGLHVLVWLRGFAPSAVERVVAEAVAAGVGVHSVGSFCLRKPRRAGFLLGYAGATRAELRAGVRELARRLDGGSP